MTNEITKTDSQLRSIARRAGYALHKSRQWKHVPNLDNYGGYMIVDSATNSVVAGSRFELDLPVVAAWLAEAVDE